MLNLFMKKIS